MHLHTLHTLNTSTPAAQPASGSSGLGRRPGAGGASGGGARGVFATMFQRSSTISHVHAEASIHGGGQGALLEVWRGTTGVCVCCTRRRPSMAEAKVRCWRCGGVRRESVCACVWQGAVLGVWQDTAGAGDGNWQGALLEV
eukprot:362627-Chlamydomonas_euryale.AAC.3